MKKPTGTITTTTEVNWYNPTKDPRHIRLWGLIDYLVEELNEKEEL